MEKNIYLLWLQGWGKAPWLQKKVLNSWKINNPNWNIRLICNDNLSEYITDAYYLFDDSKLITPQAKSDIIRLNLLCKYGGVWADSTLLCMQPLEQWASDSIKESGIWMYHGHGADLDSNLGLASWFIISEKGGYVISKWKEYCDLYWQKNDFADNYFWMDELFKKLLKTDYKFRKLWLKAPFLYCEEKGSSHTLSSYNHKMEKNNKEIKEIFKNKPPYVLKLSSNLDNIFRNKDSLNFKNSNAYYAI